MTAIIIWIIAITAVLAFLAFLAMDDRKNQRIRAEEDRLKALEEQKQAEQKRAESDKGPA